MARVHVHVEQGEVIIRLKVAELSDVLRWLMEEHLRVIDTACDEEMRIGQCL